MADEQSISPGGPNSGAATRIFMRPIASPLVLGFLALGGSTLILSGSQLGWFSPQETSYVALAMMAFGAPLQFLSSIFGFLARDPAAAAAMGVLAASWLTIGLVKLDSAPTATSTVRRKTLLPVLRVGAGRTAVEGCAGDQVEGTEREAGVREQL